MKLSAKTEYALLAMLQLAEDGAPGRPVSMRRLASRQPIPDGFLVQILQDLRRAGLVTSTRGATGGYCLSRAPEEVTLGDVVFAVECAEPIRSNLAEPTPHAEAIVAELQDACAQWRERLHRVTLADLAVRAKPATEPMYFI